MHLHDQLQSLSRGDHLCLIYDTPGEQVAAGVPFVQQGLQRRERCIYIIDDRESTPIREALSGAGVNVEEAVDQGGLVFLSQRETYLSGGTFHPGRMVDLLRSTLQQAHAAGYSGARITGEMTWALGTNVEPRCLVEYEALLNEFFPGSTGLAICQYQRHRFSAKMVQKVISTHPIAILGDQVCPNLYYEPPEIILGRASDDDVVNWRISSLRRARQNEEVLQQTNRKLQEEHRRKDEFLAMLAHELRNPLSPIQTGVELLKEARIPDPEVADLLPVMHRQIAHIVRLVDDLLDLSRISHGKIQLKEEVSDLRDLVREAVHLYQWEIRKEALTLKLDLAKGPVKVWVDPARVTQAVGNLISNAVKYTRAGGRIGVAVRKRGPDQAIVDVWDTGAGIPKGQLPVIFDMFVQGDGRGMDRHKGGLGIGLTVVKRLIEMQRGTVSASSQGPGKGSRFRISLPLAGPEAGDSGGGVAGKLEETARPRVLLVEDNPDVLRFMAVLLRKRGYEVLQATNGHEGLHIARRERPHLVLSDLGLPGLDGYALARELKSDPALKDTLLVAVSGYGQREDLERSRQAGFDAHLVKPVTTDKLKEVLAALTSAGGDREP